MAREIRFPRLNSVMLSGYLTRDIELRYTPRGIPIARMSLAFNTRYKSHEGTWVEESHFIDVKSFGEQASACATKLRKGSPIIVEGSMNTYTYTTKENQQRKVVEISANRIHFLEKQPYPAGGQDDVSSDDDDFDAHAPEEITDDDIPF